MANKIPYYNWAKWENTNQTHKKILSQFHQLQWTKSHPKYGTVVDLDRVAKWLYSDKSPVRKPLKEMDVKELSKIVEAVKGMIRKKFA